MQKAKIDSVGYENNYTLCVNFQTRLRVSIHLTEFIPRKMLINNHPSTMMRI